jgi:DNA-binding GntR family transcriptional regulator
MISKKKENKAELAYQQLRSMLLEHRFESGSRLMEPACAKKLNVNRADVRLAMTRLVSEGLLTRGETCGFYVPKLSRQQTAELYEIRFILETASARFALERATREDIHNLEKICCDMESMADGGYQMGVAEADLLFHEAMIHATHNARLDQMYQAANLPLTFVNNPKIKKDIPVLKEDARQHRMIFEALKKKNINRVIALLQASMEKRISND